MMNAYYENRKDPLWSFKTFSLSPQPHLHKEIEIVYVKSGKVTAIADRHQYPLSDGDFFIAFPNQVHYYKSCIDGDYYVLIVSQNILLGIDRETKEFLPESNSFHIESDDPVAFFLKDTVEASGKYCMTKKYGYVNLIMGSILPRLSLKPSIQSNRTTAQKIIDYCNNNFSNDLSLDSIAGGLHLNKYYISHIINKQIGLSLTNFINSLRINAACDMLKDGGKKIADISENVGFGSIRTFNRIFKDQMNMTPRAYRDTYLGIDKR